MASPEQLGLEPYRFEPILSQEEIDRRRNSAESQTVHVLLDEWCYCDNRVVMPNSDENVCCRQSDLVIPSLEDRECILMHPNYDMLIRNPDVLSLAFIQMMMYKRQQGRAPEQLSNR
jgi:hypothetical protein